jgi:hypothetical protein
MTDTKIKQRGAELCTLINQIGIDSAIYFRRYYQSQWEAVKLL